MERTHSRIHRALAVLAAPRRFQLLMLVLAGGDRSVSQLARAVRLSQSCTTRHLQALERAGLVKGWRDGKRVVFRPSPSDAEAGAVIASLSVQQAGRLPASQPAAGSGGGLEVFAVASAAELEPPHDSPESGISPEPPSPAPYWSELEDYLL